MKKRSEKCKLARRKFALGVKICPGCKCMKSLSLFGNNKTKRDGKYSYCKVCTHKMDKDRRINNLDGEKARKKKRANIIRDAIKNLKGAPCTDCQKRYPYYVMDFDHVKGKKEFNIQTGIRRRKSLKTLAVEIEKCELVCANCHRIRTHNRQHQAQRTRNTKRLLGIEI